MDRFVPRNKLSKKARRQRDLEGRTVWAFSPVTRKEESAKTYKRKPKHPGQTERDPQSREDFGGPCFTV